MRNVKEKLLHCEGGAFDSFSRLAAVYKYCMKIQKADWPICAAIGKKLHRSLRDRENMVGSKEYSCIVAGMWATCWSETKIVSSMVTETACEKTFNAFETTPWRKPLLHHVEKVRQLFSKKCCVVWINGWNGWKVGMRVSLGSLLGVLLGSLLGFL